MNDIQTNVIHCGDNLEIMRNMPDECVDLIYLDPPFFSGRDYDVIWEGEGDHSEIRSFKDTEWYRVQCPKCDREVIKADRFCSACGTSLADAKVVSKNNIYAYIDWMVPRLKEMYRILKPIGSIYLHCDWHASAYLKIEMDRIFGIDRFQNEIIWCHYGGGQSKSFFPRKHDTILIYNKGKTHIFNGDDVRVAYESDYKSTVFKGKNGAADKVYTPNEKGKLPEDFWIINRPYGKEHLGYPTQKPLALLDRIIKASSNTGDIVFDPFAGCATTMAAAQSLGRRYIGIDVSWTACKVIAQRLNIPIHMIKGMPLKNADFKKMEPMEFQQWACDQMQASNVAPGGGADGGIDGVVKSNLLTTGYERSLVQVKHTKDQKKNPVGIDVVKALFATMHDNRVKTGFIVALSFGSGAITQAAKYKNEGSVDIILIKAEDIAEKGYFKN